MGTGRLNGHFPPGASSPGGPTGFLIVRVSDRFPATTEADFAAVALGIGLADLGSIVARFGLPPPTRLIRSVTAARILELEREAEHSDFPPLRSLTGYWRLDVRRHQDSAAEILDLLNQSRDVDTAYPQHRLSVAVSGFNDPHAAEQGYLDEAERGIGAAFAWDLLEDAPLPVGFVDLEPGWNDHPDLPFSVSEVIFNEPNEPDDHGTAVMGIVAAQKNNSIGVVGIAPESTTIQLCAVSAAGVLADGIVEAIERTSSGDVLLIEVQNDALYKESGTFSIRNLPVEFSPENFDAIRLAVAVNRVVVEPAGNYGDNLSTYLSGEDSGAVMVAAARPTQDNRYPPRDDTNFGSRVDCFAWGEGVLTTGYGNHAHIVDNDTSLYGTFHGTSSASAIVAGAAVLLQTVYKQAGRPLSPGQMRLLLSDPDLGTVSTVSDDIGVMPNLARILGEGVGFLPDVYLRDHVGDPGDQPSAGSLSLSPDIFLRHQPDPKEDFAEGTGTEDSITLGYEALAGQDNFVYVRMRNRGGLDAAEVSAEIYWSEVATLVTPDQWHLIDTTDPIVVPGGDEELTVADPITWQEAQIPAPGHYCFVGLLHDPRDPAPPVPGLGEVPFDWDDFLAFVRNNNNVSWRNVNVIENTAADAQGGVELPLVIAGAPDRDLTFDFEFIQRLPVGVEVDLQVPLPLAAKLQRGGFWTGAMVRTTHAARVRLPAWPRVPAPRVVLDHGDRYRCKLFVRGARLWMKRHSLAIRQRHRREEVGRVTWLFQRR